MQILDRFCKACLMQQFNTEAEQKEFMQAFIERIDLYMEKQKDGN